jgi:hypothetical protein
MKTTACLRFGWTTFSRHFASLLVIGLSIAACQLLVHWALRLVDLGILADVVEVAVAGMFMAGLFNACRRAALGRTPRLGDAFAPFVQRPGHALAVSLVVSAGLLLAGVGVLITLFLFAFSLLLVCEGESWTQALLHSKRLVIHYPGRVLTLFAVLLMLNVVGGLTLGVGLLVTTPISVLALIALRLELEARAVPPSAMPVGLPRAR